MVCVLVVREREKMKRGRKKLPLDRDRRCYRCGKRKSGSEFYPKRSGKGPLTGGNYICKDCNTDYNYRIKCRRRIKEKGIESEIKRIEQYKNLIRIISEEINNFLEKEE